jgi:signal transduction histidine kinase
MKKLSEDRFGLLMIAAALMVIAMIAGQFLFHRVNTRDQTVRIEGRNVARVLSNFTYEQLVPAEKHNSILDLLNSQHADSGFAYAAVVDRNGQPLALSTSGAAMIPPEDIQGNATLWMTEHEFQVQPDQKSVLEFRSPLLDHGELVGYIRVGYFKPVLELQELPFIAQLALPIFLLVPLTYFLIRRELQPIKEANREINLAMQRQQITTSVDSSNNFQDFMEKFKYFVHEVDRRFKELNQENLKTQATTLALKYNRQRIESALQSLPDAVIVMDETGKTTFANSKIKSVIDLSPEDITGAKASDWCENKEVCALLEKYGNNQNRLHRSDSVEFIPSRFPEKVFSVNAYPLFTPKDTENIFGTLVVFHDKTQEILAKSARDQFISTIAHELKSPLNVIHMSAETLLTNADNTAENIVQTTNVINDEVERLTSLISNLLDITMMEAGNLVPERQRVKVADFLQDTFDSVARGKTANDVQVEIQLANNLSTIDVDKNLVRVALNNLLTNAIKYNKPGGKVTLTAEETDTQLVINISDTGIGIAERDREHIFEKFYRSDDDKVRKKSGHGLGLALAKEIIELHGGKLSLLSAPGEGSTFTITLKKTSTLLKAS